MQRRMIGNDLEVSDLGLGCMGMSEFYGSRDDEQSLTVLEKPSRGVSIFSIPLTYMAHITMKN